MYIVPSKFSDSEVDGAVKTVSGLFEKHGAKVEKTENLGKIKLAYPIKKVGYGTYLLAFIDVAGENVLAIDQELRLADEVLRHMIVKREKGIPSETFTISSYTAPITSEGKRAKKGEEKKEAPKTQEATEEKLSTKELDKKLDEILESDIVSEV